MTFSRWVFDLSREPAYFKGVTDLDTGFTSKYI
jgi:hypothetical protein